MQIVGCDSWLCLVRSTLPTFRGPALNRQVLVVVMTQPYTNSSSVEFDLVVLITEG